MQTVMRGLGMLRRFVETLGPYLILEILLPGGTLFALLLLLYRRGKLNIVSGALRTVLGVVRGLTSTFDRGFFALQPRYARVANDLHPRARHSQSRCRFGASPNDY